MKYIVIYVILFILLLLQSSIKADECYSRSQGECTRFLSKLWTAYRQKQNGNICRSFGELNTCTMKYATKCRFTDYERNLYKKDIVQTFTKEPYNCEMIGGNMMLKGGDHKTSKASSVLYSHIYNHMNIWTKVTTLIIIYCLTK
ncbi:hypothetical protein ACF0H5_016375 [Mactra antiquata]